VYTQRPAGFAYHRPTSLEEAIDILSNGEGEFRPLAGGHSLLPALKLRLGAPDALIDLSRIPGLDGIDTEGDGLRIGALVTHARVASSDVVARTCPVLSETAEGIGDRQVRARGTIGGSLAHADPGADYPTVTKALGAQVRVQGPNGQRDIAGDRFFTGLFATALDEGELITSVFVPGTGAGSGAAYEKHRHPASRYAVVGAAAVVSVDGHSCRSARVVVGGAVGSPVLVTAVTDSMEGSSISAGAIADAAATVPGSLTEHLLGDVYASAEFRAHLAEVLTRRALTSAFARAGVSV
jgi:aerobic carbon-monoxide dehydrogenase medium subunit